MGTVAKIATAANVEKSFQNLGTRGSISSSHFGLPRTLWDENDDATGRSRHCSFSKGYFAAAPSPPTLQLLQIPKPEPFARMKLHSCAMRASSAGTIVPRKNGVSVTP